MKTILASAIIALISSTAFAQSVSVADLRAQIDARVGGLNEYQELLNDPDPARSMAAMEIMMASGDPALVKMAKDYGIFSPNAAVRKAALDGYFASGPVLEMQFDLKDLRDANYFAMRAIEPYSGTVTTENTAFVQISVGDWVEKDQCFTVNGWENGLDEGCFLRNSENGTSLYFFGRWWFLTLNDQGELTGSGSGPRNSGIPISIQVAQ
ncbi:MAG: hypothetical protein GQ535_14695 [Rhodobacteraceae bacterium]|nr:hypothetical protein [Paracoccaceae bacterium]